VEFSHRWTDLGVSLAAQFTGAHLLYAAVAGCVLNDLFREADRLGLVLDGVRVSASGGFTDSWVHRSRLSRGGRLSGLAH
jgi:hypothetical protein